MANCKSASTQAAEGRTNPQTTNNRSRSTAGSPSEDSEANIRSSSASPRTQVSWNRSNRTKPAPGTRAGAPHSQSSNGLVSSRIFGGGEATPVHKTSQDQMPKRTSNGRGNLQKAQGRLPLPQSNVSSKDHPKLKHAHPLTGGKLPARNPLLADGIDTKSSLSRARNAQPSLFSTNPKHNGHLTHAPPPQMSPTRKNAANSSPKAQTTTQRALRGGQFAKSPESHNSKPVPQHSRATHDATNKGRESTASSKFTKIHVSETRHINKGNSNNRAPAEFLISPKKESTPVNNKVLRHGQQIFPTSNKDKGDGPLGRHEPSTSKKDLPHVNNKGRDEHSPKSVPLKPLTTKLFVDASTGWGIGLILDGKWLAWEFKDGWRSEGREIGWGEMVAVELAVRTLIAGKHTNCHIILRSDNQGVIGALEAGRSRGTQQNLILREIVKLIQGNELWISTTWIPTLENPADGPSRGVFPKKTLLCPFQPKLPFHLASFIHKAVDYHDPRLQ